MDIAVDGDDAGMDDRHPSRLARLIDAEVESFNFRVREDIMREGIIVREIDLLSGSGDDHARNHLFVSLADGKPLNTVCAWLAYKRFQPDGYIGRIVLFGVLQRDSTVDDPFWTGRIADCQGTGKD